MGNLTKNNSLFTRTISGVILVAILLFTGVIGGSVLLFGVVVSSLIGLFEFYKATGVFVKEGSRKDNSLFYAGFVGTILYYIMLSIGGILPVHLNISDVISNGLSIYSAFTLPDNLGRVMTIGYILTMFIAVIVMFAMFMAVYVFTFPRFTIEKVCYSLVGFIYVPLFMSFIYLTRLLPNGKFYIWLIFISSWICDTAAYFVGCSIGKNKLAPILSPKKSVEGAIGGILGSCLIAFIFGYFVEYKLFGGNNNAIRYMIICSVGAVVSQIGDLTASGIKRNKDIKDYGNLIPGHGGILDRFDSVIFTAPFIYLLTWVLF